MKAVGKTLLLLPLFLINLFAVCTPSAKPPHSIFSQQQFLGQVGSFPRPDKSLPSSSGPRLHPNVTYGPVPEEDQLFQIEFLEIAPSPVPINHIFFVLLSGTVDERYKEVQLQPGSDLSDATLSLSGSAILENGDLFNLGTITFPLRTTPFAQHALIAIREYNGPIVDHLDYVGDYDILATYWFPGMFLDTGMYTFEVVANLKNGTCLFALTFTQWLEHRNW
ncbi:hypothetical protein F5Y01DRAFT_325566 [Xylaria sp. FL0043]|nr:hypothetical protein F5Y01DRAFT_325566 [Xylaria sp. FL0043]